MKANGKTRILIADDHALVRDGLATILNLHGDFVVAGEAEDGRSAVEKANKLRPDVVLMDLMMPVLDGAEATGQIVRTLPGVKVLILTSFGNSADLHRALENGACGAVSKNLPKERLFAAIRGVLTGKRVVSPDIEQTLREDESLPALSPRHLEILHSLSRGLTNKEIAKQFGLSLAGVKFHLLTIFRLLDVSNRSEAVAIALRKHLLKI